MGADLTLPADAHRGGPALRLRGIVKRFPGVVANDGVDFEAAAGEVHALLGENGAGKSTLSSILTGLYQADEGSIELYGEQVRFRSPREALAAGVAMVHQHFRLVGPLTVAENVVLGDPRPAGARLRLRSAAIEREVAALATRYGLDVEPRARVWQLSVGEQQRVEILKALYRQARVLILDEPTAVLTPQEAEALFVTLRAMAAEGRTVIFISHKLREVAAVADRVTVLRAGKVVAAVDMVDTSPEGLAALMMGREGGAVGSRAEPYTGSGGPVLELDDLWVEGDRGVAAVRGASLVVRPGEIVGIAGVAGNGQRELAEAIAGMRAPRSGAIRAGGVALRGGNARASIAGGIAYIPEDRLGTGVAPSLAVSANLILKGYRSGDFSHGPLLWQQRVRVFAQALVERYQVRVAGIDAPARQLSGGNLQKVVLAREFSGEPKVIVAAGPTRGLDVAAIEAVHGYLRDAAARGLGVLLISEDLDEILTLAHRVVVLYEGAVVGETAAATASVAELGLLMAGGAGAGSAAGAAAAGAAA